MFKVICVENTFNDENLNFSKLSRMKVGDIYEYAPMLHPTSRFRWLILFKNKKEDCIFVDENFEYTNNSYSYDAKIKFEKYNYRKEKLERILNV